MDTSNFHLEVSSVIANDENGNKQDVTSILKQPLENSLPEYINITETSNPFDDEDEYDPNEY